MKIILRTKSRKHSISNNYYRPNITTGC